MLFSSPTGEVGRGWMRPTRNPVCKGCVSAIRTYYGLQGRIRVIRNL